MLKKMMTILLICLVMNLAVFAGGNKEAKFAEKVKSEIAKLGTGTDAKVKVKLKDGTKIKGYITEIDEDSFTVMNEQNNSATKIPYPQAKQVKGNNWSTGITIAVVAGIILLIAAIVGATSPD
jgi:small nuclear ribonucleoprotein (snRNP)-like protein